MTNAARASRQREKDSVDVAYSRHAAVRIECQSIADAFDLLSRHGRSRRQRAAGCALECRR